MYLYSRALLVSETLYDVHHFQINLRHSAASTRKCTNFLDPSSHCDLTQRYIYIYIVSLIFVYVII